MIELFNSGDPDQTPRSAASGQGLHCLVDTRLGVSSLQWDNKFPNYEQKKIYIEITSISSNIPGDSQKMRSYQGDPCYLVLWK